MANDDDISKLEQAQAPISIELTPQDQARLEKEAREEVKRELKEQKEKEFKAAAKARLKKQQLFKAGQNEKGELTEEVHINLAPHAPHIRLDNEIFYHGGRYHLNPGKAAAIKDMAHRTWLHDAEINGLDMNSFYGRQKRHEVLRPSA